MLGILHPALATTLDILAAIRGVLRDPLVTVLLEAPIMLGVLHLTALTGLVGMLPAALAGLAAPVLLQAAVRLGVLHIALAVIALAAILLRCQVMCSHPCVEP